MQRAVLGPCTRLTRVYVQSVSNLFSLRNRVRAVENGLQFERLVTRNNVSLSTFTSKWPRNCLASHWQLCAFVWRLASSVAFEAVRVLSDPSD